MSQQQNLLFSDGSNGLSNRTSGGASGRPHGSISTSPSASGRSPGRGSRGKLPIWLQRFELFLRVVVRLYVGVLVLLLPWTHLWGDNRLLNFYPWLTDVASNGVVRGIVSGLGLLNLWVAISDAIHYRES